MFIKKWYLSVSHVHTVGESEVVLKSIFKEFQFSNSKWKAIIVI